MLVFMDTLGALTGDCLLPKLGPVRREMEELTRAGDMIACPRIYAKCAK